MRRSLPRQGAPKFLYNDAIKGRLILARDSSYVGVPEDKALEVDIATCKSCVAVLVCHQLRGRERSGSVGVGGMLDAR